MIQATFFTYMLTRMDAFAAKDKIRVPNNYWRLDVCRIWLHQMVTAKEERWYTEVCLIAKSTVNTLFKYCELVVWLTDL